MTQPLEAAGDSGDDRDELRRALVRGDRSLSGIEPILGHLLTTPDHSLFSDEIVARIRGMVDDLAMQVLWAQAEATGQSGREEFADRHRVALAAEFQANSRLLAHCHSLAMEWQLTERLEAQTGLDPVLSPMIQLLIASERDEVASNAMAVLAAQARFAQAQRRMELPLRELPAELVHEVLLAWRHYNGERRSDAMVRAETKMRNGFDERLGRLSQLARLITAIGDDAREALMIEDSGAALFFSALALRSGQTRELAVLSSNAQQTARLVLGLRAGGLEAARVDEVLLQLHPSAAPHFAIADMSEKEAQTMLAEVMQGGEKL